MSAFEELVDAAVAAAPWSTPSAAKRGLDPRWPYVPVLVAHDAAENAGTGRTQTTQIRGRAFATRDEAVEFAAAHIENGRRSLRANLLDARHRALREQHGLPRELPDEARS